VKKLRKLLLAAAFLNALSWTVLIPVWQYPDEQAHFAQVQGIAETGSTLKSYPNTSYEVALSEQILETERDGFGNNKFTYHPQYHLQYSQNYLGPRENEIVNLPSSARKSLTKFEATVNPPVYYYSASVVYKIFSFSNLFSRVFAIRIFSLTLFILTVFFSYRIGKLIFPRQRILPITLTALVAFKPMLIFSSTGILPDPLTNLLFTLILLIFLKILKSGFKFPLLVILAAVVILGIFTRQQFLISIPIVLIPIIYQLGKNLKFTKKSLTFQIISISTLIFLGLIFEKVLTRYLSLPEIGFPDLKLLTDPSFKQYFVWTIRHSISEVLPWYLGVYKWLSLTVPHINYQIINRLILLSMFGLLIRLVLMVKNKKVSNSDLVLTFLITASLIYFLTFTIGDYYFNRLFGYSFGIQGRYFFPLVVFHLAILLIGLWQFLELFTKRYAKYGLVIIVLLMITFNNISLATVASSYYETTSIDTFINQVSQYKPIIFKGRIILLILFSALISQAIFLYNFLKITAKTNVR